MYVINEQTLLSRDVIVTKSVVIVLHHTQPVWQAKSSLMVISSSTSSRQDSTADVLILSLASLTLSQQQSSVAEFLRWNQSSQVLILLSCNVVILL